MQGGGGDNKGKLQYLFGNWARAESGSACTNSSVGVIDCRRRSSRTGIFRAESVMKPAIDQLLVFAFSNSLHLTRDLRCGRKGKPGYLHCFVDILLGRSDKSEIAILG